MLFSCRAGLDLEVIGCQAEDIFGHTWVNYVLCVWCNLRPQCDGSDFWNVLVFLIEYILVIKIIHEVEREQIYETDGERKEKEQ